MRAQSLLALLALLGAMLAASTACHREPTAPIIVAVQLDSESYHAVPVNQFGRYAVRMVATYQNTTESPIYLALCNRGDSVPVFSVPTVDGGVSGYDVVSDCPPTCPLQLPPGASRTDTLLIQGPHQYDGITGTWVGAISGTFRVEYSSARCADDGPACSGVGVRVVSAPFRILLR